MEQRSGRIVRQGNTNPEVHIYRYVTEATFDAYLWQTLENKQKFISQIMTSRSPVRSCEDVDETALSYAEIKALCVGDERIKEKIALDVEVAQLKVMRAAHQSKKFELEDKLLKKFPLLIEKNNLYLAGLEQDIRTLSEHPDPKDGFAGMTIQGTVFLDKKEAGTALLSARNYVNSTRTEPLLIGNYRGLEMFLHLDVLGHKYILTVRGGSSHYVELSASPHGNLTRIDNMLSNMEQYKKETQERLENLYAQEEAAKAELERPFPQEEEYREKSARLAELNAELNLDEMPTNENLLETESTVEDEWGAAA